MSWSDSYRPTSVTHIFWLSGNYGDKADAQFCNVNECCLPKADINMLDLSQPSLGTEPKLK